MSDPNKELARLHRSGGFGSIGGITFDFRCDAIEAGWEPIHDFGSGSGPGARWPYNKAPTVEFPWSKPPSRARVRSRKKLSGRELLRHIVLFGPHARVVPGDTVKIASVASHWYGDEFDAPTDAGLHRVRYCVTRADGTRYRIRNYSIYVHRDSNWAVRVGEKGTEGGLSMEVVRNRLFALLDADDVDTDGKPTARCEISAANCLDVLNRLEPDADRYRGVPGSPLELSREQALIEAGFYLAKAEAASLMYPAAKLGLLTIEGGATGGKKRAENRNRWRKEIWEPEALELATSRRARAPSISQKDLASDVQAAWRLDGEQPPFEWLLTFIRTAEKNGEIVARTPRSATLRKVVARG